jgi:protein-S-isoprenylcysteine O-methyltransferase Ste14
MLGVRAFRRARTTINPLNPEQASSVVTDGIYRHTRNPMYLGFAMMLVGWAIYLDVAWELLGPVAFVAFANRFQIVPEDRVLSLKFGRDYETYRQRVRRWV